MKNTRSLLFLAMLAFLASPVLAQHVVPCIEASWTPEVLTFYGSSAQVAQKLSKVQNNLLERRLYLIVSETQGKTEVALFERKDGENALVSQWTTVSNINLAATLNEKLLANAGSSCAGELTKAVLKTLGANQERLIPAPANVLSAYTQAALQQSADDYVRVSFFLGC